MRTIFLGSVNPAFANATAQKVILKILNDANSILDKEGVCLLVLLVLLDPTVAFDTMEHKLT